MTRTKHELWPVSGARQGILLAGGGALCAAGYLLAYRAAAVLAPPEALVLPLLLSAAVLGSLAVAGQGSLLQLRLDRSSLAVSLLLGALTALGSEAMARALAEIGAGPAAVILRSQVLFVALGGLWLLREKLTPRFWLGAAVALPGFVLLRGGGAAGPGSWNGVAWALTAALAFAGMQLVLRGCANQIQPLLINGLRLWIAVAIVACVPGRAALVARASPRVWALVAAAALFGPIVSRVLLMLSLRAITAAQCTLVMFLSPVFAFALGAACLGDWPTALELAGALLVLAGVLLPVVESARRLSTAAATITIDP